MMKQAPPPIGIDIEQARRTVEGLERAKRHIVARAEGYARLAVASEDFLLRWSERLAIESSEPEAQALAGAASALKALLAAEAEAVANDAAVVEERIAQVQELLRAAESGIVVAAPRVGKGGIV